MKGPSSRPSNIAADEAGASDGAWQLNTVLRTFEETRVGGPMTTGKFAAIPAGAKVLVGAPSAAQPFESLELLSQSIASVQGLAEAHLPLVFAKELGSKPQLMLTVFPTGNVALDQLQVAMAEVLARDQWLSGLLVTFVADPVLRRSIQAAAVQVFPHISPEWATRGKRSDTSFRQMALAIIVSLLVLVAWQLSQR